MNSIAIFVHIPRTGGSSLRAYLGTQYEPDEMLRIYGDNITTAPEYLANWFTDHPENRDDLKMIYGHFGYGIHKAIADYKRSCKYITILRHPIRRVVSLYNYIRSTSGHPMHDEVSHMYLSRFVCSGISLETDNGQVRQLCGDEGELPQVPYGTMKTAHNKCTVDMLQQAKENLANHFIAGGVTEHFNKAMNLILRRLRLENTSRFPHVNRVPGINWRALTDHQKAVIVEYNKLDVVLWGFARNLFGGVLWMWR